ncbi:hypothetical protein OAK93_01310 [bacterium]|nr:hypothetical protein [Akkermansiaceae bacterium]MDB4407276.1 hypothetical protein [bacterium]MDA7527021.1 hypothetical protein [Akkermansiaceae bacterium]MDA7537285.1 hypothetical protein [Akkermansiaceae bacterium]MDA7621017.1 hypothetical protein [Akkermansiaceae bacterium]
MIANKYLMFFISSLAAAATPGWISAPFADALPANQLLVDGNACGPTCLLSAFRSGSEKWRASISKIEGNSDSEKIRKIISAYARRPSTLDPKKARWNGRYGIASPDLVAMANELRSERWMSSVKQEIFFKNSQEKETALLARVHDKLSNSLKKGLPPILRIRRVAWRTLRGSSTKNWLTVKAHFVVLTGLPEKLPKETKSFKVTYHEPWGGKSLSGRIHISDTKSAGVRTLIARFPGSDIGKTLIGRSEPTFLSLSSAIGLF